MIDKDEEIERLKAEVEFLRAKLSRPGGTGKPRNDIVRSFIFECLDRGMKNDEIIGKKVKGEKVSRSTFFRVKKEYETKKN